MNLSEIVNCSVCSPQGISGFTYRNFNLIVIGFILPVISLFGLISNSLSVFVYSRPVMRSSVNNYLAALAVSDFAVVATAIFLFTVEGMRRYSGLTVMMIYARGTPVIFPLGTIAQTCSVYFTISAAIDCFIMLVLGKALHSKVCGLNQSIVVFVIITVFSFIYNATHFLEIETIVCYDDARSVVREEVCPTNFRMDPDYFLYYYTYGYTIFMAIGPLCLLIILNSLILTKLFMEKRKMKKAGRIDQPTSGDDPITLILVVFLFIICNSMALIVNFIESYMGEALGTTLNYLVDLSNLLVVANSSANFIIYYIFDPKFKRTLDLSCRGEPQLQADHSIMDETTNQYQPYAAENSAHIKQATNSSVLNDCTYV